MNNNLVLLCGKSATGKSASLEHIKNPEGVMYLNCENNKKLPFKSKFKEYTITDPTDVPDAIIAAENDESIHTVVVDSLTYLMDMFESTKVLTSANTMKAWGEYAQFMKNMMAQNVANSTKNIIKRYTFNILTLSALGGSSIFQKYFCCSCSQKSPN